MYNICSRLNHCYSDIDIVGSPVDNVEGCTKFVSDGEIIYLDDIKITCLLTPGHTMGHVCYFVQHEDKSVVFTGDILFVGGVGKFFEGTASDMYEALGKLTALPRDTEVYCGHEYTLSNYRFALSIDGSNTDLIEANEKMSALRQESKCTVPSTIEQEIRTNPFLRVTAPDISRHFPECSGAVELLGAVREAKNSFK
jgi:hydroxyacylglutathione hydrolase